MTTIYDVIRRPLVTEKSNYQSSKLHQYSFEVASEATRTLVKDAIETLFDVTVVRVNIMNTAAKRSRRPQPPPDGAGSWLSRRRLLPWPREAPSSFLKG